MAATRPQRQPVSATAPAAQGTRDIGPDPSATGGTEPKSVTSVPDWLRPTAMTLTPGWAAPIWSGSRATASAPALSARVTTAAEEPMRTSTADLPRKPRPRTSRARESFWSWGSAATGSWTTAPTPRTDPPKVSACGDSSARRSRLHGQRPARPASTGAAGSTARAPRRGSACQETESWPASPPYPGPSANAGVTGSAVRPRAATNADPRRRARLFMSSIVTPPRGAPDQKRPS